MDDVRTPWEKLSDEQIEDAISHLQSLVDVPGYQFFMHCIAYDYQLQIDNLVYDDDPSTVRIRQGQCRAYDVVLEHRMTLIEVLKNEKDKRVEGKGKPAQRPLNESGL